MLNNCVDGKQDYQKHVDSFVDWKDVKFQKSYNFPGNTNFRRLLLDVLHLNLIVHIKTMCFITFSSKHPICKTSLHLNRCLIKVSTKTLQVCLNQFCDHNWFLFIVLYLQVININPCQLQLHLLAAGSFTKSHFQEHLFSRTQKQKSDFFSVYNFKAKKNQYQDFFF